ncbi:MAG: tetratricopeptide repeat protein [Cyanobacteria bacterium P01_D01_bin.156]
MRSIVWCLGGFALLALIGMPGAYARESLDQQLRQPVDRAGINQRRDVADQLLRLGERQSAEGDYTSAIKAWGRAADLYYDIGDAASMERAYGNIGRAYGQLGDFSGAETAVRRQLAIARDNQNFNTQVFAWNALGTLQLQQGAVESATQAYEEALNIAYSINSNEGIGLSLSNLGLLSAAQGDYAAAIDYYEVAGDYRIRSANIAGRANTGNNLGDAYVASGQPKKAIGPYLVALSYARESENVAAQLQSIDGLIDVYMGELDWSQVRRYLDERIALTFNTSDDSVDNIRARLLTYKRLGEFYEATGERALAKEQYEWAYALARSLDQTALKAELFNRLLRFEDVQDGSD